MEVVTPSQMKRIDRRAIEELGIPGIVLMENAALQTVQVILKHYPLKNPNNHHAIKRVLVLAGCGNNGGDGFAIARHLDLIGYQVSVLIVCEGGRKPQGDANTNLQALYSMQNRSMVSVQIHWLEGKKDLDQTQEVYSMLQASDLLVDALFGTGLDRPVTGLYRSIIDLVNNPVQNGAKLRAKCMIPIVAVDIPSGINGETGQIMGTAIQATHTVAYGYLKPGHLLYPGREYAGQVHVVPISLPTDSAQSAGANLFTINDLEAAQMLRPRPRDSHKGTFGKAAIIAGSTGLTGAAHLTSLATQRTGAGLVTLGIPEALNPIMEQKLTEVMTYPLEDRGQGHLVIESLRGITELLQDKDVLAFGPGCGKYPDVFEILRNILGKVHISIVIDADGLNHISKDMKLLRSHRAPVILTPHPGEMSRMTGLNLQDIVSKPIEVATQVAFQYGCTVLLKGATSVVAEPSGRVYINTSGNAGMAKGGSGDILTGMIAALVAQGYPPFEATVLGCYIHGRAGDEAARQLGQTGMIAVDMIHAIPTILKGLYASMTPSNMPTTIVADIT